MLGTLAVTLFVLSAAAVAATAIPFPEMRLPSGALLLAAALQVAGLFWPGLRPVAFLFSQLAGFLSLAAVLLSLLAGTIGGSFHIDEAIQPVLWSMAGVAVAGGLLLANRRLQRPS